MARHSHDQLQDSAEQARRDRKALVANMVEPDTKAPKLPDRRLESDGSQGYLSHDSSLFDIFAEDTVYLVRDIYGDGEPRRIFVHTKSRIGRGARTLRSLHVLVDTPIRVPGQDVSLQVEALSVDGNGHILSYSKTIGNESNLTEGELEAARADGGAADILLHSLARVEGFELASAA